MRKKHATDDWLPLAKRERARRELPTGEAFRPEWIDFSRGIRVGNLAPHERITQILKFHLEGKYDTPFVIDRWGRGAHWRWICWLPKANRAAKPISHDVNFGCAKLFIGIEFGARIFKAGLQIERGFAEGPAPYAGALLAEDWDWHRLFEQCAAGSALEAELERLIGREGFAAELGDFDHKRSFTRASWRSAGHLRRALRGYSGRRFAAFQLYYPTPERELQRSSGYELVKATLAVFDEVVPAMNACMQVRLEGRR